MVLAAIMEFGGALGVGARVADTIRTKIVQTERFSGDPSVLMLGMMCAVMGSSIWLTLATRIGMPVSTTHSIMGGVIGMGVAALGADGVTWVASGGGTDLINGGVVQVFLGWIIAPCLAGLFGAILFTITKYGVMLRKDPVKMAFFAIPFYFWLTSSLLVMLLVWKGGNYKVELTDPQIAGTIVGTGAGFAMLVSAFLLPWIYRVVILEDWQLRWYHLAHGPMLLKRGPVPPPPADFGGPIRNYYEGHLTRDEIDERRTDTNGHRDEEASAGQPTSAEKKVMDATLDSENQSKQSGDNQVTPAPANGARPYKSFVGPKPEGRLLSGPVLFWWVKYAIFRGVDRDIVSMQGEKDVLSGDLEEVHARSAHYNNKAEFMYTFLQILTACAASFTHGANDVSNAIGPYATIFQIWQTEQIPSKSDVPLWILAFGGIGIVLGLWTYGYNIMSNLGNKLTLQSPSRGFSMELGSTITIIIATRLSKYHRLPAACSHTRTLSYRAKLTAFASLQNSPSPPPSASRAPSSVSVSATATGGRSTGA